MPEKKSSETKHASSVRPANLQFFHPLANLQIHISRLQTQVELDAGKLKKCDNDEDRLRLLQNEGQSKLRLVEIAETSARGINPSLRFGWRGGAGSLETRIREVLIQLHDIYRRPKELIEHGEIYPSFLQCHEQLTIVNRQLHATPVDPNDEAKLMWPVFITVFHIRLKQVADGLHDLASQAGTSNDNIAESRKVVEASIDALDDMLEVVRAQLADALHLHGQYHWSLEFLPFSLRLVADWLADGDQYLRADARDTLRHLRLLLTILQVSQKPEMSPEAQARMWAEFPAEARTMKLPHPTLLDKPKKDASGKPNDLISSRVALTRFVVSRTTLLRHVNKPTITSYRPPNAPVNAPHFFSESELDRYFERRDTAKTL